MATIKYREGYKYQIAEDYTVKTDIIGYQADTEFIKLTVIGVFTLRSGYASDGPSGPTIDTLDFMRGAFVHDGFYELLRQGFIPQEEREKIDQLLRKLCIEDGMGELRAGYVYVGVRKGGASAADPKNIKEVFTAPNIEELI